jgi:hypothetical protein
MSRTFLAHVGAREATQLVIHQRHELFQGTFVALTPRHEELGYAVGLGFAHNNSLEPGSMTKRSGAKRVGNAIPVRFSKSIGKCDERWH